MIDQRRAEYERREALLNRIRIVLHGGGQPGDRERAGKLEVALQGALAKVVPVT